MAGNGETVIELDKKRMTAMAQKDYASLNDLLADWRAPHPRRPGKYLRGSQMFALSVV